MSSDGTGPAARYVPPPPFAPYAAPQVPFPGPPQHYWAMSPGSPAPQAPTRLEFGIGGAGIGGAGFLLVAIAMVGLPWLSASDIETTSDIRGYLAERGEIANGLSVAYFSWFGWVLLVLAAGGAVLAAMPRPGLSLAFRIAGPVVSAFAVLFTVGAIELTSSEYGEGGQYYHFLSYGFWIALVGFTLTGVGALVGPRRVPAGVTVAG